MTKREEEHLNESDDSEEAVWALDLQGLLRGGAGKTPSRRRVGDVRSAALGFERGRVIRATASKKDASTCEKDCQPVT